VGWIMSWTVAILLLVFYAILGYKKPAVALITSPILSIGTGYILFWVEPIIAILFGAAIFLVTLVGILLARREPGTEQWPHECAKWILIGLASFLFLAVAFVVFGPGGIFGAVLFVLFVGAVISYGLASRQATAAYVISTIGSSMRQNLPLPMALESAASGRMDKRARILLNIKKWLVEGYSLSESIKRGYPRCPGYALAMIGAAERIDQLPLAVESLEADMIARAQERRKLRPVHPFYPVILMLFVFFMVWALATRVAPRLHEVLQETFHEGAGHPAVVFPAATRFLMRIAGFIGYEYGWLIGLVAGLALLVIVGVWIRIKFRPRQPQSPYLLSRIGDAIKWHLPILHWFERNYAMVQVVEFLRLSLNAGCPVDVAIKNTLGLDVNNCFRKRLKSWLAKVEAGDNIAAAARKSGLGHTVAWAFDEQVNQGDTLALLEMLESFYRSNYSYRVNLARFIMWPCVSIVLGVIVGFVVYAFFCPLVLIINQMTNLVYP
jgi:type II secretory pathway component PulF